MGGSYHKLLLILGVTGVVILLLVLLLVWLYGRSFESGRKGGDAAGAGTGGEREGDRTGERGRESEQEDALRTLHTCWGFWDVEAPPPTASTHWAAAGIRHRRMWGPAECEALIAEEFPWALSGWRAAVPIQKCDLARYAIIAAKGGWYADLDAEVLGGFQVGDEGACQARAVDIDGKTHRVWDRSMALGCVESTVASPPWTYVGNFAFYAPRYHPWPIEMLRDAALHVLLYRQPELDAGDKVPPRFQRLILMSAGPGTSNRTAIVNEDLHVEDIEPRSGTIRSAAPHTPNINTSARRRLRQDIALLHGVVRNKAHGGWRSPRHRR